MKIVINYLFVSLYVCLSVTQCFAQDFWSGGRVSAALRGVIYLFLF